MWPKCKSGERYRLKDKMPPILPDTQGFSWHPAFVADTKEVQISHLTKEQLESFRCSNCGYEIGRWG